MGDALDDILNSALDEIEEDGGDGAGLDLQNAAKSAAGRSYEGAMRGAEQAKEAGASSSGAGLGGDEDAEMEMAKLLQQLQDPEIAKTLEETFSKLSSGDQASVDELAKESLMSSMAQGDGEMDENVAKTLKMLAEASKGMEGADASQAEEMGEELMQKMMEEFEKMGQKDDFASVVDGMMHQLLSKDVMYEPMKQVCDKFPEWLADNEDKLPKEEYERYGQQYQFFQRILAVYDSEPDNFARLMELFQDMQDLGQPPADIIKELAPGLKFGPDGMPMLPNMGPGVPGLPPGVDPNCSVM